MYYYINSKEIIKSILKVYSYINLKSKLKIIQLKSKNIKEISQNKSKIKLSLLK